MAVVVIEREELESMIERAVRRALDRGAEPEQEPVEWLDTRAAAKLLQVHPKTLGRMVRRGEVPATKLNREYRFRRADLEAMLAA